MSDEPAWISRDDLARMTEETHRALLPAEVKAAVLEALAGIAEGFERGATFVIVDVDGVQTRFRLVT